MAAADSSEDQFVVEKTEEGVKFEEQQLPIDINYSKLAGAWAGPVNPECIRRLDLFLLKCRLSSHRFWKAAREQSVCPFTCRLACRQKEGSC